MQFKNRANPGTMSPATPKDFPGARGKDSMDPGRSHRPGLAEEDTLTTLLWKLPPRALPYDQYIYSYV